MRALVPTKRGNAPCDKRESLLAKRVSQAVILYILRGGRVQIDRHLGGYLQKSGGHNAVVSAVIHFEHALRLLLPKGDDHDLPCGNNGLDAHGVRPLRHIINAAEPVGKLKPGLIRQLLNMGAGGIRGGRLIIAYVGVGAQPQHHKVKPAGGGYNIIIA